MDEFCCMLKCVCVGVWQCPIFLLGQHCGNWNILSNKNILNSSSKSPPDKPSSLIIHVQNRELLYLPLLFVWLCWWHGEMSTLSFVVFLKVWWSNNLLQDHLELLLKMEIPQLHPRPTESLLLRLGLRS